MAENKTIKVWLDESLTEDEFNELVRWEGEGGTPTKPNKLNITVDKPIEPGQTFKVVKGDLAYDDGALYYIAEIELEDED